MPVALTAPKGPNFVLKPTSRNVVYGNFVCCPQFFCSRYTFGAIHSAMALWMFALAFSVKQKLTSLVGIAIIKRLKGHILSLARVVGIEPTSTGLEAVILPLNYTRSGQTQTRTARPLTRPSTIVAICFSFPCMVYTPPTGVLQ